MMLLEKLSWEKAEKKGLINEANINEALLCLKYQEYDKHFLDLWANGADVEAVVDRMSTQAVDEHFDELVMMNTPPLLLLDKLQPLAVARHRKALLALGASPVEILYVLLLFDEIDPSTYRGDFVEQYISGEVFDALIRGDIDFADVK